MLPMLIGKQSTQAYECLVIN